MYDMFDRPAENDEEGAKRECKKLKEKERREKMNTKFSQLAGILGVADESKVDRVTMLSDSIALIHKLRRENEEMRTERLRLQAVNDRLATYLQFLFPGVSVDAILGPLAQPTNISSMHSSAGTTNHSIAANGVDHVATAAAILSANAMLSTANTTTVNQTPCSSTRQQDLISAATETISSASAPIPIPLQANMQGAASTSALPSSSPSAHEQSEMPRMDEDKLKSIQPLDAFDIHNLGSKEYDQDVMLSLMCYLDGKSQPYGYPRLDYEHDQNGDLSGLDEDTSPLA
eukprot:TRINITY_DN1607_c0_g2_i2.p1 TRINITY_DN1607_c0_g2~~TRINITY_DN1607_c0_g2_i2.p1  ORF type:complete len:288 (+),score=75.59 TRINITY_DN1607_c0_g2_i2:189-1052(+)